MSLVRPSNSIQCPGNPASWRSLMAHAFQYRHGRSGFYQSQVIYEPPASSAGEFGPFLAMYGALVARCGVAADERFTAVLNRITKARRQRYNAAYNAAYRLGRINTVKTLTRYRK